MNMKKTKIGAQKLFSLLDSQFESGLLCKTLRMFFEKITGMEILPVSQINTLCVSEEGNLKLGISPDTTIFQVNIILHQLSKSGSTTKDELIFFVSSRELYSESKVTLKKVENIYSAINHKRNLKEFIRCLR